MKATSSCARLRRGEVLVSFGDQTIEFQVLLTRGNFCRILHDDHLSQRWAVSANTIDRVDKPGGRHGGDRFGIVDPIGISDSRNCVLDGMKTAPSLAIASAVM